MLSISDNLKHKLQRLKLVRRSSGSASSAETTTSTTPPSSAEGPGTDLTGPRLRSPPSLPSPQSPADRSSLPASRRAFSSPRPLDGPDQQESPAPKDTLLQQKPGTDLEGMTDRDITSTPRPKHLPALTVQQPTPDPKPVDALPPPIIPPAPSQPGVAPILPPIRPQPPPTPISRTVSFRPSLSRSKTTDPYIPSQLRGVLNQRSDEALVVDIKPLDPSKAQPPPPSMARRKIWVKRPGASATLVQVAEDDLVDDVRDMILRKYANSLGRSFDSPDVALRVIPSPRSAHVGNERTLGPEEPMCRTLDTYFPGGQTVNEALVIDVPTKRTPKHSPRLLSLHGHHHPSHGHEEHRPTEEDIGYFPPMPPGQLTPREQRATHHPHSIAILETGQAPALPSPRDRKSHNRPRMNRQQTSSPTSHMSNSSPASYGTNRQNRSRRDSNDVLKNAGHAPKPPPLPTPPASDAVPSILNSQKVATPPMTPLHPSAVSSSTKTKKSRKQNTGIQQQQPRNAPPLSLGAEALLNGGAVPPINVLLVEDNIINLKLLEAFVKRLKVRWSSVMNGRDAVNKWREGGFHLVLMDIQLPIMNGLEATKAIRRLERINGIGVFARSRGDARPPTQLYSSESGEGDESTAAEGEGAGENGKEATTTVRKRRRSLATDDKLPASGTFKSPVIIVALTASSLQSDRHEALAAGCNDFLTKPVNFPWFERKVMEWGCMQALIDFDGWRTWKAFDQPGGAGGEGDEEKAKKEETEEERIKREKKEERRAAILAKMGGGG